MKSRTSVLVVALFMAGCQCCPRPCPEDPVHETYVHRYGVPMPQVDWVSRGQNGQVVAKMKDGVAVTRTYDAGVLEGDTTYSFPHSETVDRTHTYVKGSVVREAQNYPSGMPMEQTNYESETNSTVLGWYENGAPRSKEAYDGDALVEGEYYILSGQVESKVNDGRGTRTMRDQFGLLVSKDTIADGQMVSQTVFYPNGSPKAITPFNNDSIHGQVATFQAGGEPNTTEEWVDGKQHGWTTVYQNGEKFADVPYQGGAKVGTETRYVNGDVTIEEISWKNGKKEGPCRTYVDGRPKTRWYYQDREVTKAGYDVLTRPAP